MSSEDASASSSTPAQVQAPDRRPVVRPETFEGKEGEWTAWIEQFELAAQMNGWNTAECLNYLILSLRGPARKFCSDLPQDLKRSYRLLTEALQQHFEPPVHADWNRAAFLDRRRKVGESIRDFGYDVCRLAAKAYPDYSAGTRDSLARDHFITNIGNADIRVHLRSSKPQTLEEAIHLAAELDQIRQLEGQDVPQHKINVCGSSEDTKGKIMVPRELIESLCDSVKQLQTEVRHLAGRVNQQTTTGGPEGATGGGERQPIGDQHQGRGRARLPGSDRTQTPTAPSRACYHCGCKMHLKRDCPYLPKDGRADTQNPGATVASGAVGPGLYIKASIADVDCEVMVDSGASVSVIQEKIWRDATGGRMELLTPYSEPITAANGQHLAVIGRWSTVMNIDGLRLAGDLVVASDVDHGALIGTDFLSKYGAVIDMQKRVCTILGKQVPLISRGGTGSLCRVVVMEDIVIPPRSEMFIPAIVEGTLIEEGIEGVMEPCTEVTEKNHVLIARSLGRSVQGKLPVRVMNVSPEPQCLRQGTKLGGFCIWEDCCELIV